jgi:hypothetical protein
VSQPTKDGFTYTAEYGLRIGNDHRKSFANNMDAAYLAKGREVVVGGIADGCGGTGEHSEVSALFFIEWLCKRLLSLLEGPTGPTPISLQSAIDTLWNEYLESLQAMLDMQFKNLPKHDAVTDIKAKRNFADRVMLHTVVMYVAMYDHANNAWQAYLIYRGDGYVIVDDSMINIEDIEGANYGGVLYPTLALQIFDGFLSKSAQEAAHQSFGMVDLGVSGINWRRIGVASDGLRFLTNDMLNDIAFPPYKDQSQVPAGHGKATTAITEAINWAIRDTRLVLGDDLSITNFIVTSLNQPASEHVAVEEAVTELDVIPVIIDGGLSPQSETENTGNQDVAEPNISQAQVDANVIQAVIKGAFNL